MNVFKSEFDYLTSGNESDALDFFCFNNYSWCGKSSMQTSGYDRLVTIFANAHVPVFFSEYGCNIPSPRLFLETHAIYSSEMTGVFSGGIVYEFFELVNRYGLVKLAETGELETLQDFHNLKNSFEQCLDVRPNTLAVWSDSQFTSTKAPTMPAKSSYWQASTELPGCPVDWDEARSELEDGQWVDVEREIREFEVDDLADSMWQRFRISGTGPRWT
ncbi:hypothetical protein TruAng_005411 [Truncatella angustata]|nr:hypothetical protein TruAng_005411 [Truncatella angustata]